MKKVKFLFSIILIVMVFIFIGEFHIWHLEEIESGYTYTTMYPKQNISQEEMLKDIQMAAINNNTEVFVVDRMVESIFSLTLNLYCTEGAWADLTTQSGIKQGSYDSLFLGHIAVNVYPFESIPDVSKIEVYRLIGSADNLIRFKQELIDKYAGNFPRPVQASADNQMIIAGIWGIVFLLFLLMTLYEVSLLKKEAIVRMLSGETLRHFVAKNIGIDLLMYLSIMTLSFLFVGQFSKTDFGWVITVIASAAFLFINSLIYCRLFITDFRKDVASKEGAKTTLKIGYAYKVTAVIITLVAMSGNIKLIENGIDYYQQRGFFEEHNEYSNFMICPDEENWDWEFSKNKDLFKSYLADNSSFTLADLTLGEADFECVLADRGALSYLNTTIRGFDSGGLTEKVYILLPKKYSQKNSVLQDVMDIWTMYYRGEDADIEIIEYSGKSSILAVENSMNITSRLLDTPIVILNNLSESSYDDFWNFIFFSNVTMLKIQPEDFNDFIKENQLENGICYLTNSYENYLFHWKMVKRTMLMGIVLLAILVIINAIIIKSVLQYEYTINAKELSLRKLMGYSLLERHRKMFVVTAVSGAIGLAGAFVLSMVLQTSSLWHIALCGLLVIMIEIGFVLWYLHKMDTLNTQKILQGGIL